MFTRRVAFRIRADSSAEFTRIVEGQFPLRVWETRCPCCRTSAMRWLHLFAVAAFSLTVLFYLLVTAR